LPRRTVAFSVEKKKRKEERGCFLDRECGESPSAGEGEDKLANRLHSLSSQGKKREEQKGERFCRQWFHEKKKVSRIILDTPSQGQKRGRGTEGLFSQLERKGCPTPGPIRGKGSRNGFQERGREDRKTHHLKSRFMVYRMLD